MDKKENRLSKGKKSNFSKKTSKGGFNKDKSKDENYKSKVRKYKKGAGKRPSGKELNKSTDFTEPTRLNKFIASAGICSRRDADDLISKGKVKVNGKVITEMGYKVSIKDKVEVEGKAINPEKKVYILLNKPKDCVSTVKDKHADKTVLDIIDHEGNERLYPVGRLDRNTTGVLLITNDGDLTKKLTHPSHQKKKIYHVFLDKVISKGELQDILEGIELEDGLIKADSIDFANENDKREVGIEIHSGKNRVVRRIFAHLGYNVEKLDRVYFAGLTKKNLPRGRWRYLTEKEVGQLKRGAL